MVCGGGIVELSLGLMLKTIIIVVAGIVFGYYATVVFEETFGEDRERVMEARP